ncbi:MAG: hypothetical protein WD467_00790 [Candidatus Saccharimonadales bacterium]
MLLNQKGNTTNVVIWTLAFMSVTLLVLSTWALYKYYLERTTVDDQVKAAVETARADQQELAEAEFEIERRSPYRTYTAPDIYGGISIDFPKNWSVYVEDSTAAREQIDLYIHPQIVRLQRNVDAPYAFRLQLRDELYSEVVEDYQSSIEQGELSSRAVTVADIDGVRLSGQISGEQTGTAVVLPYRDKTILLWTEGGNYVAEFNDMLDRAQISR